MFTCDGPQCTNGGMDGGAKIGDWLYDENNCERFRPSKVHLHSVASGRNGLRTTFTLRDPGRIPNASAPVSFPRIALNQPPQLDNQRLQLWWTGRWNATWYCKTCIATCYSLSLIQVDDFLRLRADRRAFEEGRGAPGARRPGTRCDPGALVTPAGTAPRVATDPPLPTDCFYTRLL